MKLSVIVAVAQNGVIGRDGRLPWRLPADLQHFKSVTMGKPILMGRKTWASIGRPLPGRRNLVVTRDAHYRAEGAEVFRSVEAALAAVAGEPEVMVIGGAELYRALLPRAQSLYLTRVLDAPEGTTFFPELGSDWRKVSESRRPADAQNPCALIFEVWQRP